jgi:hypothetical protein
VTMRQINGDNVMSGAKGSGTYTASLTNGPGIGDVLLLVHVTALSGTTPALSVSLEQSPDGASWSAVGGSATASLTAIGNATTNGQITQSYARVTATVTGTTPSITFRVAALVFAE